MALVLIVSPCPSEAAAPAGKNVWRQFQSPLSHDQLWLKAIRAQNQKE